MGLYWGGGGGKGAYYRSAFANEIWWAYIQEGLFSGGLLSAYFIYEMRK